MSKIMLELQKNIGEILELVPNDAKIIPGHGPLGTRKDLVDYKRMLDETIAAIKANKDSGKSLDECKAAGVPKAWAGLGESGFIKTPQWVEIVFNSL